jgi:flagellar basal-body rod protein FlgG
MDRGLYIAASGMLAEQARQDAIANDLANASTPGYKADHVESRSFPDVLLENTQTGAAIGPMGQGVRIAQQVTDTTPAALKPTDEPLDLGIQGDGWFAVRTPQGTRYTRNGAFRADARGQLVDQLGNAVLDRQSRPVRVKADGTIDPKTVGVVALANPRKTGDSYVTGAARGAATGQVQTGVLEASGVDSARTIVDMIASMRRFEAGQKAITTIDETLRAATQQVGTISG